jgi:anaphase-promoting complex subunit 5
MVPCAGRSLTNANGDSEDFNAAGHHLEQLRPARAFGDVEVTFEIILLEVELLLKKREYTTALHIVNTKIKELKANPKSGSSFPIPP